jgi:CheY-like chemotaxis protein
MLKDSVRFILRGTKSKAKFKIADDLWNIDVDLGQLGQVINNLIINSVHAMPDGGIIEIEAKNIADGSKVEHELAKNKYVKISVKDHGSGIPDNIRDKIFDPYFTTKTKGTGLGLAGAHSIINNHSGYIKFESQAGVGTLFEIYLPASRKKVPQKIKDFDQTIGGEGKILIMDDEKQVLTITKSILIHIGFRVETAENGKEAIRKYKAAFNSNNPYQAVILDLTIPGGFGGVRTIEKILEFDPMVKGVAMSGYSNDAVIAEYKDYGFTGVITKPYTVQQFNMVMRRVLKK